MAKVRCSNCKEYVYKDEAFSIPMANFCSEECFQEKHHAKAEKHFEKARARAGKTSATKAPGKRKRTSGKTRKEPFPEGLKEQVLAADHYQCRGCGYRGNLRCHHIIYRSQGGRHVLENLITLCDECHVKVHSNKKRYKPLCEMLVAGRGTPMNWITLKQLEREFDGRQEAQD